ncbi:MAG: UDP-diphosphatase [Bacteroidetes bacterium]|nr:MAG: UDP-diphosphatase [Bacteroidota bacterium]
MSVFEAFVLGMLQGLTEFLPVSSSGHIQFGAYFFDIDTSENLVFTVIVHGATVLSTLIVFWKEIGKIIRGVFKFEYNEETKFFLYILFSMIPVGVVGVFFKSEVEALFDGKIVFVASMLMVTGFLLAATNYIKADTKTGELNYTKAFIIGLAQAFAVVPGISRSGATIATGLMVGVKKEQATRFSFLMVIIPILGASLLQVLDIIENPAITGNTSATALGVGFITALVFGIFACRWMIKIVQKGKLIYFAAYCFIVATFVLVMQLI